MRRIASFCPAALVVALSFTVSAAENWPQFRGPRADGTSSEAISLPLKVLWKSLLPGPGHSSPIVWNDRVFLTAFEREASLIGSLLGRRGRLLLLSLDRTSGKLLWQKQIPAKGIEKTTSINQPASPTPVTDGRYVFAYFGSYGIIAVDFEGRQIWENKIGPFPHHMGTGSSPILVGDRLFLNVESDGPAFLYAINKRNGRTLWRTPRKTALAGYATPFAWNGSIVVAGSERLAAYDLSDGYERWTVEGLSTYVVPTPVSDGVLLFATSSGPGGSVVLAVKPSGQVAWKVNKGAAYVASPVLYHNRLFTVNRNCTVSCLDTRGTLVWTARLGARGDCYASPVVAGGLLHIVASSGEVYSLEAGREFAIRNTLDLVETTIASPAISGGLLFVRSDDHLFAIGSAAVPGNRPK